MIKHLCVCDLLVCMYFGEGNEGCLWISPSVLPRAEGTFLTTSPHSRRLFHDTGIFRSLPLELWDLASAGSVTGGGELYSDSETSSTRRPVASTTYTWILRVPIGHRRWFEGSRKVDKIPPCNRFSHIWDYHESMWYQSLVLHIFFLEWSTWTNLLKHSLLPVPQPKWQFRVSQTHHRPRLDIVLRWNPIEIPIGHGWLCQSMVGPINGTGGLTFSVIQDVIVKPVAGLMSYHWCTTAPDAETDTIFMPSNS